MKTKSIQKIALYLLLLLLGMVPFQLQAQITVKITQRDPTIIIPLDAKVFLKVLWNMEEGKIFFYKDKELENLNITCNSQSVGVGLGKTEAKFPVEKNKKSGNYNIIYDGGTQKTINIVFDWSKAEPQAKTPASAGTTATPVPPVEKKIDPVEELVQKIRTQNFKSRANEFEDESFQYIQPDKVIESSPEEIRRMLKTGNALYSNLNLYLVKIQDTKGSAADRKRLRPDSLELARYAGKVNSINVQLAVKSISKQKSDLIFKKFETTFLPQYNLDACTRQIERAERALDKPDLIRWLNLLIGGYKGDLNSGIKELDKKLSGLDHTFGLFSNTESRSFGVSEEIISALLSMQKENVVASIKKKQKEMQEMAEKISSVRPPYGSFALIAVTLFIVIYGGYFYARAYKKRQIKAKEEQKRREERAKKPGRDQGTKYRFGPHGRWNQFAGRCAKLLCHQCT